jgi:hypothetical protein
MVNEMALKDSLIMLAMDAKTNFIMIASLTNELAALRESVRGLDPTFVDVLEMKRDESEVRGGDSVQRAIAGYDALIQRLTSGQGC